VKLKELKEESQREMYNQIIELFMMAKRWKKPKCPLKDNEYSEYNIYIFIYITL
jgi:hypothetical protein